MGDNHDQDYRSDSLVLQEIPHDFCNATDTNATPLNIKFDGNNTSIRQNKTDSMVPERNQTDLLIAVEKNNTSFENGFQMENFEGLSFNQGNVSMTEQNECTKKKTIQSQYSSSALANPPQSINQIQSQSRSALIQRQTNTMKNSQQSEQSSENRRQSSSIPQEAPQIKIRKNQIEQQVEEQLVEQVDEMIPLLQKQQATIMNAEYLIEECKYDEASTILQLCFEQTQKALVCRPSKDLELQYTVFCVRALVMDANIMRKTGNYFESTGLLVRCTKLFKINDPDTLSKIYQECARNSLHMKKLQDSINFFIKALKVYERVKWKLDIASVLVQLGEVYAILSSHEDAKKLCYEAISIFKKRLPENDIRIAEAYHTLGYVFFMDKDYEMAVEFYVKSLQAKVMLYGEGGHISMVRTYNLMGVAYQCMEQTSRAIESYDCGLKIYGDKPAQGFAQLMNNLGVAYIDKGLIDSAQKCFDRAMEMTHILKYCSQQKIQKNKKLVT